MTFLALLVALAAAVAWAVTRRREWGVIAGVAAGVLVVLVVLGSGLDGRFD